MKMQLHEREQLLAQFDLLEHHLHLLRRVANGLLSPDPPYLGGLLLTVKSETEFIVGELHRRNDQERMAAQAQAVARPPTPAAKDGGAP
jgi:hypothetical protein